MGSRPGLSLGLVPAGSLGGLAHPPVVHGGTCRGAPLAEGLSCLPWGWLWRRHRGLCEGPSTWAAARPAWAHPWP